MIKFVLVFIAVILMALGIYNYSNQNTEIHTPNPTISEKKKEAKEIEKVSVVTQEVKEKKSSVKNLTGASPKVVSQEPTQEIRDEKEIEEGLTLESIENADVSDEERERMISLAAYRETSSRERVTNLSEEDFLKILKNHFDNTNK